MTKPPKIKRGSEFDLDVSHPKNVDMIKKYQQEVKQAIMRFRSTMLVKGNLSRDLMWVHRNINNPVELAAKWNNLSHAKATRDKPTCKHGKVNICALFTALTAAVWIQDLSSPENDTGLIENLITVLIARLDALGVHSINSFVIAGNDREGYWLKLKKGCGLRGQIKC